ncbi:hypothetical protein [Bradyrhizobium sp. Leo121]|uniref:hypothetical protein n=1 Tax=Bradyrhizobium sp. Leo121 TaxID=1571195 RepID=UPI001029F82C|nr:hypothetical protein [Bradyrhizobium sp. Leo121]RZN33889.1 hypothetical protein CWO90_08645 [Bradyrhizobium sp. Leo121]
MITRTLMAAVAVVSLVAMPALAQTVDKEKNGHHSNGGPKTEVPHHMGKKETIGKSKGTTSGGHHYTGDPNTSTPHHMGDKQ